MPSALLSGTIATALAEASCVSVPRARPGAVGVLPPKAKMLARAFANTENVRPMPRDREATAEAEAESMRENCRLEESETDAADEAAKVRK